jgi:hypothetical protein
MYTFHAVFGPVSHTHMRIVEESESIRLAEEPPEIYLPWQEQICDLLSLKDFREHQSLSRIYHIIILLLWPPTTKFLSSPDKAIFGLF